MNDWKNDLEVNDIDFDGKSFKQFKFDARWSDGKDFRLVSCLWNSKTCLSEKLINKWYAAILHATQTFSQWKSSSYMRWHRPILAELLLKEDNNMIEQLYQL